MNPMSSVQEIIRKREEEYTAHARDLARKVGTELITPAGATKLFDKSHGAIRAAIHRNDVHASFQLQAAAKVSLIDLQSAIQQWGQPPADLLEKMRGTSTPLWVSNVSGNGGVTYVVMHDKPLVTLREVE